MLRLRRRTDARTVGSRRVPRAMLSSLGLSFLFGLGSCTRPLSDDECLDLLSHYVELLANTDRPSTTAHAKHQMKLKARAMAKRDPEFHECRESVSRRAFECAIKAISVDEFEKCLM